MQQGDSEVDKVREAYLHDPSVSQEDYARLIEAADETDRAREAAAELSDEQEERMTDDNNTHTYIEQALKAQEGVTLGLYEAWDCEDATEHEAALKHMLELNWKLAMLFEAYLGITEEESSWIGTEVARAAAKDIIEKGNA